MKSKVRRLCEIRVIGDDKYKPFVEEAVYKFLEYIDVYLKRGWLDSLKLDIYTKELDKNEE